MSADLGISCNNESYADDLYQLSRCGYAKLEYIIIFIAMLGLASLAVKFHANKNPVKYQPQIYSRTFTISKVHPIIEGEGVEFISVAEDGTATINTLFSSEILDAKQSEFFVGNDYGLHGLQLVSSSYKDQEIVLKRFLPEDLEEE